jgi:hypothetical protein
MYLDGTRNGEVLDAWIVLLTCQCVPSRITNSQLEQAPEDIRNMQKLKGVTMNNCQLSAFNVAAGLPALHTMYVASPLAYPNGYELTFALT